MIAETRPRTGSQSLQASSTIRPPRLRLVRCIARAARWAGSPASCDIPTCSRRWRPICPNSHRLVAICRRLDTAIDTSSGKEIGERVREELDYQREAQACRALSRDARRLRHRARAERLARFCRRGGSLTLDWLDGTRCWNHTNDPLAARNALATAMFTAWWFPFSRLASSMATRISAITQCFERDGEAAGHQSARLWLHPDFPAEIRPRRGRSLSWAAARRRRTDRRTPTKPGASASCRAISIETLNIWARFIYAPLLDDRVRTIADGVAASASTAAARRSACIRRSSAKGR